jgi:hypothetical protein
MSDVRRFPWDIALGLLFFAVVVACVVLVAHATFSHPRQEDATAPGRYTAYPIRVPEGTVYVIETSTIGSPQGVVFVPAKEGE